MAENNYPYIRLDDKNCKRPEKVKKKPEPTNPNLEITQKDPNIIRLTFETKINVLSKSPEEYIKENVRKSHIKRTVSPEY